MVAIRLDCIGRLAGIPVEEAQDLARRWSVANPAHIDAVSARPPRYTGPTKANPLGIHERLYAGSWFRSKDDPTMGGIKFPLGLLEEVLALYPDAPVHDLRESFHSDPGDLGLVLRDYQRAAVEALAARDCGMLVAPTGSGKTATMLGLVHRIGDRVLVLAHTNTLIDQWRIEVSSKLGAWGRENVTVATVQSYAGNKSRAPKDLPPHGVVIVDEGHHASSATYRDVLTRSHARRRYGCTATPTRADGLSAVMHWQLGPIRAAVKHEKPIQDGHLVVARTVTVQTGFRPIAVRRTGRKRIVVCLADVADCERVAARAVAFASDDVAVDGIEIGKGVNVLEASECLRAALGSRVFRLIIAAENGCKPAAFDFGDLVKQITTDEARNSLVASIAVRDAREGHVVLVLSQRVDHAEALAALISAAGVPAHAVTSGVSSKKRAEYLADVREGRVLVVTATQVFDEGMDMPIMGRLILATPQRSENNTMQRAGRIMRPSPGKGEPVIYDLVDDHGLLRGQRASRARAFKKARGEGADEPEQRRIV